MIKTALIINTKNWKHLKCLTTGKWINKLLYIHSMENYSAAKLNKLFTHATTCMNIIMVQERNQSQKVTTYQYVYRQFPTYYSSTYAFSTLQWCESEKHSLENVP